MWVAANIPEAVAGYIKAPLDFIYINTSPNYCAVTEALAALWPRLKPGGIMAGHKYATAAEILQWFPERDWAQCAGDMRHDGAVAGAVNDFFQSLGAQVTVTYREGALNSWLVRKPLMMAASQLPAGDTGTYLTYHDGYDACVGFCLSYLSIVLGH